MFSQIGKKIKLLAQVFCYLLIAVSIVSGIMIIATPEIAHAMGFQPLAAGLLVMLAGSLLSWLNSILLYGFGELVDNTAQIKAALTGEEEKPAAQKASPFSALTRAASQAVDKARAARQQQPAPAQQQPQQPQPQPDARAAYQPPQTTPASQQPRPTGYTQPAATAYQRPGSYAPAQARPLWVQTDAQSVQCPNCRMVVPIAQVKRYGCCPQCRMPYQQ